MDLYMSAFEYAMIADFYQHYLIMLIGWPLFLELGFLAKLYQCWNYMYFSKVHIGPPILYIILIKDREILDLIVESVSTSGCKSGTASGCTSGTTCGILYRTTSQTLIELHLYYDSWVLLFACRFWFPLSFHTSGWPSITMLPAALFDIPWLGRLQS